MVSVFSYTHSPFLPYLTGRVRQIAFPGGLGLEPHPLGQVLHTPSYLHPGRVPILGTGNVQSRFGVGPKSQVCQRFKREFFDITLTHQQPEVLSNGADSSLGGRLAPGIRA